jgi:hypothetical protein
MRSFESTGVFVLAALVLGLVAGCSGAYEDLLDEAKGDVRVDTSTRVSAAQYNANVAFPSSYLFRSDSLRDNADPVFRLQCDGAKGFDAMSRYEIQSEAPR